MNKKHKIYCFIEKYCFLDRKGNCRLDESRKRGLAVDLTSQPSSKAILWMIRHTNKPLNHHLVAWILNLPAHHVYHDLMLLHQQFLIVKDARENWYPLDRSEIARQKQIAELSGLLELYSGMGHSILQKEFGDKQLVTLNNFEVRKFRKKFLKCIDKTERIAC